MLVVLRLVKLQNWYEYYNRHLRATGIKLTEQFDADGGADIAGIATAGFVHVGRLTSGRYFAGAGGSITGWFKSNI